jgi:hypothetical protein
MRYAAVRGGDKMGDTTLRAIPAIGFGDDIPPGTFHGGDDIPAGTFH